MEMQNWKQEAGEVPPAPTPQQNGGGAGHMPENRYSDINMLLDQE